jgi:hypothetical protein
VGSVSTFKATNDPPATAGGTDFIITAQGFTGLRAFLALSNQPFQEQMMMSLEN